MKDAFWLWSLYFCSERRIPLKLLRQLLLILTICFSGEVINRLFGLPIPGNIIGMIMLFLCLYTGIVKLEMIADIARFLLDHLAFFFVPAGVGLMAYLDIIESSWPTILLISLITTIIVMLITGHTVQLLKGGKKDEGTG